MDDERLKMFRVSPGEVFHVRSPQQQAAKLKWRTGRVPRPSDLILPRWVIALAFVMLVIGLIHAAVASG